jgi:S1-C subfamily serine protease
VEVGVRMRRSYPLLLAVGLVFHMVLLGAADWTLLVRDLAKSVVPIELDDRGTSCTGFVINSKVRKDDEDRDYVMTAAHCEAAKMFADQSAAKVVYKNTDKDLLVLEVEDLDRPALKLAKDNPKLGEEVASFGFGYGLEKPMLRMTHISAETYIPYEGIGGPLFMTDATFVGGQSGGPVINADGEVVMIVQRGTNSVGIGVGAEVIRAKMGRFWEKPAAKP